MNLGDRRLYLCTPDRPDLADFLVACIRGGVDVVQLRDKVLDARPLIARARVARGVCASHGVPFILNDRPDLALEVEADGVHVGQDDAAPAEARAVVGPDRIVGRSTHAPGQGAAAAADPDVDYLSIGPVHATPTKPGRTPTGLEYVRWAAANVRKPWFAIGGIDAVTIASVVEAGASRVVVVRAITEAPDALAAAAELRASLEVVTGGRA